MLLFSCEKRSNVPAKEAQSKIASISSLRNDVKRRIHKHIDWDKIELNHDIYQKDSLRTLDNSEATITFAGGSDLIVGENSLVVIEVPEETENELQARIFLKEGTFNQIIREGAKRNLRMEVRTNQITTLITSEKGRVGFKYDDKKKLKIAVYSGKTKIESTTTMDSIEASRLALEKRKAQKLVSSNTTTLRKLKGKELSLEKKSKGDRKKKTGYDREFKKLREEINELKVRGEKIRNKLKKIQKRDTAPVLEIAVYGDGEALIAPISSELPGDQQPDKSDASLKVKDEEESEKIPGIPAKPEPVQFITLNPNEIIQIGRTPAPAGVKPLKNPGRIDILTQNFEPEESTEPQKKEPVKLEKIVQKPIPVKSVVPKAVKRPGVHLNLERAKKLQKKRKNRPVVFKKKLSALNKPQLVRIHWNAIKKAEKYFIDVSKSRYFHSIIKTEVTTKISLQINLGDYKPGTYYWRVAPVVNGNTQDYQKINRFKITE